MSVRPGTAWRELVHGLGVVLMPPACAVCRAPMSVSFTPGVPDIVCGVCVARIQRLTEPQCVRCGHPRLSKESPLPAGTASTGSPEAIPPCRWCERLPPFVRAVRSVCRMDVGTGAALVHALKYGGWSAVARPMARHMARVSWPDDVRRERTALIPLPLGAIRERERGYNQAERLATALAQSWEIPVWRDLLVRTRNTRSQVQLTPSERVGNVSGAFSASGSGVERLHGSHIILVDDVITTAASLNAAALALTKGGARIISYITFGRAPEPGDRTTFDV